ncbi:MAG: hypothetical protein JWN61_1945 [Pseudonocardiales bacterium]|nr:hypothetical protein [Pseudonocardiales bacterium]
MSIAASLILMAIGAILAFAVRDTMDSVDLTAVGYIVMALGAAALLITLVMMTTRRRTDVIQAPGRTVIVEPNQIDPRL